MVRTRIADLLMFSLVSVVAIFLYPKMAKDDTAMQRALFLTSILDGLNEATVITDWDGKIEFFSKGAANLFHTSSINVLKKPFFWMLDPTLASFHADRLSRHSFPVDGKTYIVQGQIKRWDGTTFNGQVRMQAIYTSPGTKQYSFYIKIRDLNEVVSLDATHFNNPSDPRP